MPENTTASNGQVTTTTLGNVVEVLKRDGAARAARMGWNAHHVVGCQQPDENSANTLPYLFMVVGSDAQDLQGKRVPWTVSQTDLLATDWYLVGVTA